MSPLERPSQQGVVSEAVAALSTLATAWGLGKWALNKYLDARSKTPLYDEARQKEFDKSWVQKYEIKGGGEQALIAAQFVRKIELTPEVQLRKIILQGPGGILDLFTLPGIRADKVSVQILEKTTDRVFVEDRSPLSPNIRFAIRVPEPSSFMNVMLLLHELAHSATDEGVLAIVENAKLFEEFGYEYEHSSRFPRIDAERKTVEANEAAKTCLEEIVRQKLPQFREEIDHMLTTRPWRNNINFHRAVLYCVKVMSEQAADRILWQWMDKVSGTLGVSPHEHREAIPDFMATTRQRLLPRESDKKTPAEMKNAALDSYAANHPLSQIIRHCFLTPGTLDNPHFPYIF